MAPNNPAKIGITGGIGAGKSIVSRIFQIIGIPVYNADQQAKWLMNNDPELIHAIKKQFGKESYQADQLNRSFMAEKVFADPKALDKLNRLVHPRVGKDYDGWVESHSKVSYTLKEAALLFESGSYKSLDAVILVTAPEELRIKRVVSRDQRSKSQIEDIIKRQWSEADKQKLSTYEIRNDDRHLVIPQVLQIHESIIQSNHQTSHW